MVDYSETIEVYTHVWYKSWYTYSKLTEYMEIYMC